MDVMMEKKEKRIEKKKTNIKSYINDVRNRFIYFRQGFF